MLVNYSDIFIYIMLYVLLFGISFLFFIKILIIVA